MIGLTAAATGAINPYKAARATFTAELGWPAGAGAERALARFDDPADLATSTLGALPRLEPGRSAFAALYFLVGRHTGLLRLLPGRRRAARRRAAPPRPRRPRGARRLRRARPLLPALAAGQLLRRRDLLRQPLHPRRAAARRPGARRAAAAQAPGRGLGRRVRRRRLGADFGRDHRALRRDQPEPRLRRALPPAPLRVDRLAPRRPARPLLVGRLPPLRRPLRARRELELHRRHRRRAAPRSRWRRRGRGTRSAWWSPPTAARRRWSSPTGGGASDIRSPSTRRARRAGGRRPAGAGVAPAPLLVAGRPPLPRAPAPLRDRELRRASHDGAGALPRRARRPPPTGFGREVLMALAPTAAISGGASLVPVRISEHRRLRVDERGGARGPARLPLLARGRRRRLHLAGADAAAPPGARPAARSRPRCASTGRACRAATT